MLSEILDRIPPADYEVGAFFLLVFVFEVWERRRPARPIDRFADLRLDVLSFGLALAMNRASSGGVKYLIHEIAPRFVQDSLQSLWTLNGAAKIGLSLVVADFIIYWIHRAQHRFDSLWRTHAWHHSVERLYWFSGFRTSFTHSLIYNIPQAAVPLLLFGMSPVQAGIAYSIGLLIQFWEHTNVKVQIGPLKWVFITPDYHRVHHSANAWSRTNFGTTFSLWDRMFGTYTDPATVPENTPMGLGEPLERKRMPRMLLGV
jgi:sterol desaturase/sphingolipid hydroxylase (fatty acid hydroxylase superfamily)